MDHWLLRATPSILVAWLTLEALLPRQSALRLLYVANTYVLLPLVLLLVIVARLRWRGGRPAGRPGLPDIGLALFVALALGSIVFAGESGEVAFERLLLLDRAFLVPFAAFWLARLSRPSASQLAAWVPVLAGLCLLEAVVGGLALFRPAAMPAFWPGSVGEMGGLRLTGTLPQPDTFAAVAVFAATVVFCQTAWRPGVAVRAAGGAILVTGFAAAFASFSRASWLGGIGVLAILALAHRRRLIVPALGIALAVVAISRVPASLGGAPAARVEDVGHADAKRGSRARATAGEPSYALTRLGNRTTISDRVVLDVAGLRMFFASPWVGWGFGSYDEHARSFVTRVGRFVPSDWAEIEAASHNTVVSVLAEMGVAGFACLALPVAWTVARAGRALRRGARDRFLLTLCANLALLAVVSMSIDLRYVAPVSGLAWLLLGLAAARAEDDERAA